MNKYSQKTSLGLVFVASTLMLAGCASTSSTDAPQAAKEGQASIANIFPYGGLTVPPAAPVVDEVECPEMSVKTGAAALSNGSGPALRWQATIGEYGRECRLKGDNFTFKVGMEGRILLGPAGGAGRYSVPVVFELRKGFDVIATRSARVDVTVAAGQTQGVFEYIAPEFSVPVSAGAPTSYEIVVGFAGVNNAASSEPKPRRIAPTGQPQTEEAPRPAKKKPQVDPSTAHPHDTMPKFQDVKP
jgi:hypothetical protein